jgi:hypothetical protein
MEVSWERPLFAYLALSGVSLLVATVLGSVPDPLLPPLFAVLGPTAWLLWGIPMAPFYLLATATFATCLTAAIFVPLRSRGTARVVPWLVGLVWLLLGLAAWNFTV